jgi:hypothetical protein
MPSIIQSLSAQRRGCGAGERHPRRHISHQSGCSCAGAGVVYKSEELMTIASSKQISKSKHIVISLEILITFICLVPNA